MTVKQVLKFPASEIKQNETFYEFMNGSNKVIILIIDKQQLIQYSDASDHFLDKCITWLKDNKLIKDN